MEIEEVRLELEKHSGNILVHRSNRSQIVCIYYDYVRESFSAYSFLTNKIGTWDERQMLGFIEKGVWIDTGISSKELSILLAKKLNKLI